MNIPFLRQDEAEYGRAQNVAPGVRRVLCQNPGPFTWRGTNSYIVGEGRVAIIDPGPADEAQLAALLEATAGEVVTHIIISHTHRDHSPGAKALQALTGAQTYGFGPHMTPREAGGEGGDHDFKPDVRVADNEEIAGDGWRLTALHTPGHCANHLCFGMEGNGVLFSADHVMSWSTTVVSPPDGNMRAYMNSLARLRDREGQDSLYLPGHGPPLAEPMPFLDALAVHRRRREARVVAALREVGPSTALALVGPVYGPMDPKLVGAASRSLLANLEMLAEEGVVTREGDAWAMA
ncbi:MBL fold metallo-hydrolase [Rhodovarius crocodyli]|uniref:MBL fold metallo-hydrolase n=1 Tax=Rhodovarius crocodyli TaxID=1979269 RepID=A0A437MG79_9PROT|nr:MBL fold metallo-hydrolase [Rhodovarius crocodyli]RVT96668.1 MBL fold metallo-hydrolase [Rhodovarius crocodyli]